MSRIKELLELGRQSYALATGTLNPEAKKTLQDMGKQYVQEADELRRIKITRTLPRTFGRQHSGRYTDSAPGVVLVGLLPAVQSKHASRVGERLLSRVERTCRMSFSKPKKVKA